MTDPNQASHGRRLLRSLDSGILATMSLELPGYPFGSVTPFVLAHTGELLIQVSSIAQHTKNMLADPRVCLTVAESGRGNKQALGRISVVGDARPVDAAGQAQAAERYFRFFPEARGYAQTHDFSFYAIAPKRLRFIGGFGQIFWIEPDAWNQSAPTWAAEEDGMIEHMNRDHADALAHMAQRAVDPGRAAPVGADANKDGPQLIAIDPEGTHLRVEDGVHYLPFEERADDADGVRRAMIALTRAARDS